MDFLVSLLGRLFVKLLPTLEPLLIQAINQQLDALISRATDGSAVGQVESLIGRIVKSVEPQIIALFESHTAQFLSAVSASSAVAAAVAASAESQTSAPASSP